MTLSMHEGNHIDVSVAPHVEISIASLPMDQHNGVDVSVLSTKKMQSNDRLII